MGLCCFAPLMSLGLIWAIGVPRVPTESLALIGVISSFSIFVDYEAWMQSLFLL
jgi:hypothetical protein